VNDERKAELLAAYPSLGQFGDGCWQGVAYEIADTLRPGPAVVRMLEDLAERRRELAESRELEQSNTVYVATPDNGMWSYNARDGWSQVFVPTPNVPLVEVPWRRNQDGSLAHPAYIPPAPHPRDISWTTRRADMHDPDKEVVRTWTPATLAREAYQWGRADAQDIARGRRPAFQGRNLHLGNVTLEALRDDTVGKVGGVAADESSYRMNGPR